MSTLQVLYWFMTQTRIDCGSSREFDYHTQSSMCRSALRLETTRPA